MIAIKLKEAMEAYRRRTGTRLTYAALAKLSGVAQATLQIIGSRDDYNATLELIEKLCLALNATPGDLLELVKAPPKAKAGRTARKTKKRKQ